MPNNNSKSESPETAAPDYDGRNPYPPVLAAVGTADIAVGSPQDVGGRGNRRRIVPILGGAVHGNHLEGAILPGGGDWQIVKPDGTTEIDARYTVQTNDGSLIYVETLGLRCPTQAGGAEAPVDPASDYFRLSVKFETESSSHRWLTEHLVIGSATKHSGGIRCVFYLVY